MSKNPPPPSNAPRPSDRNEYIPDFIQKKPFFAADLLDDNDYLEHQRSKAGPRDTIAESKWYSRTKSGPAATKYRKGACENCGALTHKAKDCLNRPRKQGAKWTGRDIQADERVEDVALGWDAKRDRWNGYDAREYDGVVQSFKDMESLQKGQDGALLRADGPGDEANEKAADESDVKYAEESDMGRSQPTSTRQLRLREDTAKYLVNLDLDSAKYDPKTRSMDTTTQNLNAADSSADLASEGFVRPADDAAAFEKAQKYAWEEQENATTTSSAAAAAANMSGASNANSRLHLEANPTASALNIRQAEAASSAARATKKSVLLSAYGDQSTYSSSAARPAVSTSERFVEYDEKGLIKGQRKEKRKSKYPEDVRTNNHTAIWGSWWSQGKWGYACCWSCVKNSYCTGEDGKKAFQEEEAQKQGMNLITDSKADSLDASGDKRPLEDDDGHQGVPKRAKMDI